MTAVDAIAAMSTTLPERRRNSGAPTVRHHNVKRFLEMSVSGE